MGEPVYVGKDYGTLVQVRQEEVTSPRLVRLIEIAKSVQWKTEIPDNYKHRGY